jgi:hypothetical protein
MAELRLKSTGTIKLFENDNTSNITIASPASLGADRTITLPDASVTLASGTMLATDGSGASLTALNASELGSGTVPTARLGSGTASSSTVLYGDQTYKTEPTGASTLNELTDVSMDITNFVDSLVIQTNSDGSAPTTGTLSSASNNIGIGKDVFKTLTTGTENTCIGTAAGQDLTEGVGNVIIGISAGENVTTGTYNTLIGRTAGDTITDGDYNILIGTGPDVATGAQNVVTLGDCVHANSNNITIGWGVDSGGDNIFAFGKASPSRVYNDFSANATWARGSDERIKKDIQTNTDCGLDFIDDLRTVTFKKKSPSELDPSMDAYNTEDTDAHPNKLYGFIAQEVKAAMDTHSITDFAGWNCLPQENNPDELQAISHEMFVIPLVKAVQELSTKVKSLEEENTSIKARLTVLENA